MYVINILPCVAGWNPLSCPLPSSPGHPRMYYEMDWGSCNSEYCWRELGRVMEPGRETEMIWLVVAGYRSILSGAAVVCLRIDETVVSKEHFQYFVEL